jgi:hypothetical protein
MAVFEHPPRYRSFLLRCWQERSQHPECPPLWRFSLHDPHTAAHAGFATLDDLITALRQEFAAGDDEASLPSIQTGIRAIELREELD